jgi:hypothetical protein
MPLNTVPIDVVARQRKVGIDVISDGELGKVGFSNYVIQRMSGFEGKADFIAADFADAFGVAIDAFGSEGAQRLRLPILNGPIEMRDTLAVDRRSRISNPLSAIHRRTMLLFRPSRRARSRSIFPTAITSRTSHEKGLAHKKRSVPACLDLRF